MAVEGLEEFLRNVGPEFEGKAQLILDATGAQDVEELVDLVETREDLRDLDHEKVGMKALHIKKLLKAILQAKSRAPAPQPALAPPTQEAAQPPPETEAAARPPAPKVFPKLEKAMTAVPEDRVKEPSYYVACSDASKHDEIPLPAPQPQAGPPEAKTEQVPLPDPMKRGPLLFNMPRAAAATSAPEEKPKKFKVAKDGSDFPRLGPAGEMPEVTRAALEGGSGVAAAQRAFQAAELARLAAEQAERAAAEAAAGTSAATMNAAVARHMLHDRRAAYHLRSEAYDRVVEFFWDKDTFKFVNGRAQYGTPSPISALAEEDFNLEFDAALNAFCEANQPEGGLTWKTPEIEEWLAYEPSPAKSKKGKEIKPYALVMFKSLEDVQYLEHLYHLSMQAKEMGTIPIMKIASQAVMVRRPNPDFVRRLESTRGSETASQAASAAGSECSHSSVSPGAYRNLTLLFQGLPEAVHASLSQRPAARQAIEAYARKVLDGPPALPVARDTVQFAASFSEPKKAPYGGCWLTFRYAVEKKRVSPGDGKAYTFERFKELHKGKKSEADILKLWARGTDAVFEVEKMLAGGGKPNSSPISIARWFMDRIKAKTVEAPAGAEKGKTWTECEVGGCKLSVEYKRPG